MDSTMIKDKMIQMATKLGMSPDTIKAMQDDSLSATPSSVTVAVVKPVSTEAPESEDKVFEECAKFTDEQIDKMSEQEAKDYLKKVRDASKEDVESDKEEMPTPNPKPTNRIMDAKVM